MPDAFNMKCKMFATEVFKLQRNGSAPKVTKGRNNKESLKNNLKHMAS